MSKKKIKKLIRKEAWKATREERKQKEKEKLKLRKKVAAEAGIELPSRKRLKLCTMATSRCKQKIAVDLSFDNLMSDKDLNKCIKQIHRCYSNNRRAENPAQFYLTSFKGQCLEVMEKNVGFRNWDVYFEENNYLDIFPHSSVVYLTSDSDNVIETLDENKIYVIGGLVDHNGHKGLCHELAVKNGISHGRLPIGEYMNMKTSKVLTIDHVFQILLEVAQGKTWKDAFLTIIPARKGAVLKEKCINNLNLDSKEAFIQNSDKDIKNSSEINQNLITLNKNTSFIS